MAWGLEKKEAVLKAISRHINTEIPASLLQLHNDIILIVDKKIYSSSTVTDPLSYPNKIWIYSSNIINTAVPCWYFQIFLIPIFIARFIDNPN